MSAALAACVPHAAALVATGVTVDVAWPGAGARAFTRPSNRAGGIEGGMSNGEMIRALGYLKPLASLPQPLASASAPSTAIVVTKCL